MLTPIKKIENLKFCSEHDRSTIILVYLSLKPACEVYIYKKSSFVKLKKILNSVGLYCVESNYNNTAFKEIQKEFKEKIIIPTGLCSIARDEKTAIRLSKTLSQKHHRRYGKLMGYPQTAIDNFVKKEKQLDYSKFTLLTLKYGIIFNFRIPAKNYQSEIELLKSWSRAIKENAPDLYKSI